MCLSDCHSTSHFSSEEGIREHYRALHSANVSEAELSLVTRYSRQETKLERCLICHSDVGICDDVAAAVFLSTRAHNDNILACMGTHLESLALTCLPWQLNNHIATRSSEAQGSDREVDLGSEDEEDGSDSSRGNLAGSHSATLYSLKRTGDAMSTATTYQLVETWTQEMNGVGNDYEALDDAGESPRESSLPPPIEFPRSGPVRCRYPGCNRTFPDEYMLSVHDGSHERERMDKGVITTDRDQPYLRTEREDQPNMPPERYNERATQWKVWQMLRKPTPRGPD